MSITDKLQIAAFAANSVAQLAFLLIYRRRPWRGYVVGRALMILGVVLLALFLVPLVHVWLDYPGEEWVEVAVFWSVFAAILWKIRSMRKASQVIGPKEPGV